MMKKILACSMAVMLLFSLTACKKRNAQEEALSEAEEMADPNEAAWTMLESMPLEDKIYQMFMVTPEMLTGEEAVSEAKDEMRDSLAEHPVGGILFGSANIQDKKQLTKLLKDVQEETTIPLFTAISEGFGGSSQFAGKENMDISETPSFRELGNGNDATAVYDKAKTMASELTAYGFNVNFGVTGDFALVNTSDNRETFFGSDAGLVAAMTESMVRGLRENGMAAGICHFPGEGNATLDGRRKRTERSFDEMQDAELYPFKYGIEAGADFVIVSNMISKDMTKTDMECSMSTNVMTNILRKTMGFPNIVITDCYNDASITDFYSAEGAVITAIEAGADMILMPADMEKAVKAVKIAVEKGRISEMRINESVSRILKIKIERGII